MENMKRHRTQNLFFVIFVLSFFLLIFLVENSESQKAVFVGRIAYIPFVLFFGSIGIHMHAILESKKN